jgi:HSP20 family protein
MKAVDPMVRVDFTLRSSEHRCPSDHADAPSFMTDGSERYATRGRRPNKRMNRGGKSMANERQTGQQVQRAERPAEGERAAGRGGREGTQVQRSQTGEYQRGGGWLPSAYTGTDEGPFAMMRRLSDEMDRLFEGFGMGRGLWPSLGRGFAGAGGEAPSLWSPHVEMCERGGKLVVSVDLPGIKREDVDVEIDQDGITIQGERKQESTTNERGFYRSERSYGRFYRQLPLPEGVSADSAAATFRDGVLEIEMDAPQRQSKGRRLEIKESGGTSGAGGSSAPGTH